MSEKHIADGEGTFTIANVNPDFCKVGNQIIPFDIYQTLTPEKEDYSTTMFARGAKVLKVASVVSGTIGNAGTGILSGVSGAAGHSVMMQGDPKCFVDGSPAVRHLDLCMMNVAL